MSGFSQVKAKRKYESGCKGTVEKASFRYRTVNWEVAGGALGRRLYGLLTTVLIGIIASFMKWRS